MFSFSNTPTRVGVFLYAALTAILGYITGSWIAAICFSLAAYAVVANDAVQTLMTYINSNRDLSRLLLWAGASALLVFSLWYGFYTYDGDISYGRLSAKGYEDVPMKPYLIIFPAVLLLLTWRGIPVSTSLLMLSIFSSGLLFEKIVLKSAMGYLISFIFAYLIWGSIEWYLSQKKSTAETEKKKPSLFWRIMQSITTALLWWTWLSHDMVNIAVFLPSSLSIEVLVLVTLIFILGLAHTFYLQGGKVGDVVTKKICTNRIIAATIIDLVYFIILLVFREWSNIPMSTTWVFVGLLAGRQLSIRTINRLDTVKKPIAKGLSEIWKDLWKILMGLGISIVSLVIVRALIGNNVFSHYSHIFMNFFA